MPGVKINVDKYLNKKFKIIGNPCEAVHRDVTVKKILQRLKHYSTPSIRGNLMKSIEMMKKCAKILSRNL